MNLLTVGKQTLEKVSWVSGSEWDGSYEYMEIRKAGMQKTSRVIRKVQT